MDRSGTQNQQPRHPLSTGWYITSLCVAALCLAVLGGSLSAQGTSDFVSDSDNNTSADAITVNPDVLVYPHGGYAASTDRCAACHRTHTSQSPILIVSAPAGY